MRFSFPLGSALAIALVTLARPAAADDTTDCIAASEAAQTLRDTHALIEAESKLLSCSRDVCPGPVKADCIDERAQVEAAMPSIVLRAKDVHGQDTVDVRAFVDGVLLATELDGRALPIDPGLHTLRFEPQGAPAIEQKIVVSEGEKNRLVLVEASPDAAARPTPPRVAEAPAEKPAPPFAGISIPGLIVGGVGVVATIPMTILWITGTGDIHQMRTTCAPPGGPGCPPDRVDSDHTKLVAGDVFLGVAVAGVAAGAVLLITHRPGAEKEKSGGEALRIDASPLPGGGFVAATARF